MDKKYFTIIMAVILMAGMCGHSFAALLDRGNGLIYDDDLDITWYDFTFVANNWTEANNWAENLVYAGFDDWRLPTMPPNPNFTQTCLTNPPDTADRGWNKTTSELGHLFYTELGNLGLRVPAFECTGEQAGWGLTNTGPFTNLQTGQAYWTNTPFGGHHWNFSFFSGGQGTADNNTQGYGIVVRDGDVVPQFTEVGSSAGVNDSGNGAGVAWGDYDGDGDSDFYLANNGTNLLYRSNGDGTFTEVGSSAGVNDSSNGRGVAWGDYDNDGDLDLYLANFNGANRLYQNDGNDTFTEVGSSASVNDSGGGDGVAWGDYDGDGDLDLFVANRSSGLLYQNGGSGTFAQVTSSAGTNSSGNSHSGVWGDYDSDGDLDLYVTDPGGTNWLYQNSGNGAFAEVTASAGVNYTGGGHGVGAAWGDYDGDGDLDLAVAMSNNAVNVLYQNDGDGIFSEVASSAGVNDGGQGQGIAWADYDNDGNLDLYVVNSGSANRLYRNGGSGTFLEVGSSEGVHDSGSGSGASWADYDGDGDQDLYVTNTSSANQLYKNAGNTNRWLTVKLVGMSSNKSGIGVKVTAVTGSTRQRRDVEGGSGYLSQPSLTVEFGFGETITVDSLIVEWPSEQVQTQTSVSTNQTLTVTEAMPDLQIAGKISYSSGSGTSSEIYVANADGTDQTRLTNNAAVDDHPSWSPDGSKIAFHSGRDGGNRMYVMNADGTDQTRLTNDSTEEMYPTWSPDSRKIVFFLSRDGNYEIYVMNADGTDQINLTNNSATDAYPSWSPDGSKIVFYTDRDGNNEIYVMNADGTGQTRLTNNSAADIGPPSWSSDGSKIAFVSLRDGNNEIYAMNADGTGQTRLTNNSGDDIHPIWSLDSSRIAFSSTRDGSIDIYVMDADGTGVTRVTNNTAPDSAPSWGESIRHISSALVGISVSRTLTIENNGSASLSVTNITSSDNQFTISPGTFTVAPGDSQNVTVAFAPTSAGTKYATLTILSNDPDAATTRLIANGIGALAVWPGDTNNDGAVGIVDVLPLGRYWGSGGSARSTTGCTWTGYLAVPWAPLAATYANANGDDIVNQEDLACIGENWGRTHAVAKSLAVETREEGRLQLLVESSPAGYEVAVRVQDAGDLLGLSFILGYEPKERLKPFEVEAGASLGDAVVFSRVDEAAGEVAVAVVGKAGQGVISGDEIAARLQVAGSSLAEGRFWIAQAWGRDARGRILMLVGTQRELAGARRGLPESFALAQSYPNPFNAATVIRYQLPVSIAVHLTVYDILGHPVRRLVEGWQAAGYYQLTWDGRDERSRAVSSGVYFYQLEAGTFAQVRRMVVLR